MAPGCFHHSDGWSVLFIGYYLAGIKLPWYEKSVTRTADIDASKTSCLLGDAFRYDERSLDALADGSFCAAWRKDSQEKLVKYKWPFACFMGELFRALIQNELDMLRSNAKAHLGWARYVRRLKLRT